MAFENIIYQKEDNVGIITLNRPKQLNALSKGLRSEVSQVLDEIGKDDEVRTVVLTGSPRLDGRPCFCAGDDLTEQAESVPKTKYEDYKILESVEGLIFPGENDFRRLTRKIRELPKIVIAAIDGVCTAGGSEIACSCDIRVVSETAQFSDLHMKNLGRVGGGGITALLAFCVGPAWAKEIIISGDVIDGNQAVKIGLANHVFPPGKMLEGAKELAKKIAQRNPNAVRMCKAAVNYTIHQQLEDSLRYNYLVRAVLEPAHSGKEAAKNFFAGKEKGK